MASLTRSGGPIIRRAQNASRLPPRIHKRLLHATTHRRSVSEDRSQPLNRRLASAWNDTPTKWYPLSFGAGALLLLGMWLKKSDVFSSQDSALVQTDSEGREVAHLKGRWQVHVLGALPLRNMSRLWGYLNGLELPVWFRPFGFKLYAAIFGCNLDEMKEPDLTTYKSLGDFFYRELKDGVRPVANTALVSPADGTVLHFGQITDFRVEQVKGLTYSLDALLGADFPAPPPNTPSSSGTSTPVEADGPRKEMDVVAHQEFANVNGIEYSLDQLLGSGHKKTPTLDAPSSSEETSTSKSWWSWRPWRRSSSSPAPTEPATEHSHAGDVSVQTETKDMPDALAHDAGVAASMGLTPSLTRRRSWSGAHGLKSASSPDSALFFCVVYLAPGDYHRFHSPAPWVVERRRHFVGELFSVSPYVARRLENLFVLNERVALLGRWKYGFFGMVPVGATNVGSIRVNFDQQLRTNVKGVRPPPGTYTEATYEAASTLLGGQPLAQAEEMGGFRLGSTVVLVFEAPRAWDWKIEAGQKVKVGQALGDVRST